MTRKVKERAHPAAMPTCSTAPHSYVRIAGESISTSRSATLMGKKTYAVMSWLMVYGWAILAILTAIVVFGYFLSR